MFALLERVARAASPWRHSGAADIARSAPPPDACDRDNAQLQVTPASWPSAQRSWQRSLEIFRFGGGCCG